MGTLGPMCLVCWHLCSQGNYVGNFVPTFLHTSYVLLPHDTRLFGSLKLFRGKLDHAIQGTNYTEAGFLQRTAAAACKNHERARPEAEGRASLGSEAILAPRSSSSSTKRFQSTSTAMKWPCPEFADFRSFCRSLAWSFHCHRTSTLLCPGLLPFPCRLCLLRPPKSSCRRTFYENLPA